MNAGLQKSRCGSNGSVATDLAVQDATANESECVHAEAIRDNAYYKWQATGCPTGDGSEFWLEAEKECAANRVAQSQAIVGSYGNPQVGNQIA